MINDMKKNCVKSCIELNQKALESFERIIMVKNHD